MKLRVLTSVAVAGVLALSLSACSKKTEEANTGATADAAMTAPVETANTTETGNMAVGNAVEAGNMPAGDAMAGNAMAGNAMAGNAATP